MPCLAFAWLFRRSVVRSDHNAESTGVAREATSGIMGGRHEHRGKQHDHNAGPLPLHRARRAATVRCFCVACRPLFVARTHAPRRSPRAPLGSAQRFCTSAGWSFAFAAESGVVAPYGVHEHRGHQHDHNVESTVEAPWGHPGETPWGHRGRQHDHNTEARNSPWAQPAPAPAPQTLGVPWDLHNWGDA